MPILCGDIGGTKTRIALLDIRSTPPRTHREKTYPSARHASLEEVLTDFYKEIPRAPRIAGFGLAGPVRNGRCEATNLPWVVDAGSLTRTLGLEHTHLVNDLEATAWGIAALAPEDLYELHPGSSDAGGNLSITAAGTGLGQAGVCRVGGCAVPFASEGGHCDFAPADELETELYRHLSERYGHVSWERVVSGMGITEIFGFLSLYRGQEPAPALAREMALGDAAGAISRAAEQGECPLCEECMGLFTRLYGREAGNHALKVMATGGVYLGGGIAPKILGRLKRPEFLQAFFAKGRMEPLMRSMPVRVILNDRAALYGAALAAAQATAVA